MPRLRAAVVQAAPVAFDREKTIEKARTLAARTALDKAQLVVFPEAFVSAYPRGLDFGARVGMRTPEGREEFRRYFDSAVDVPGPAVDALGNIAQENNIYLVIGVIERDGGTLYCTVLFFAPDGDIVRVFKQPRGSLELVVALKREPDLGKGHGVFRRMRVFAQKLRANGGELDGKYVFRHSVRHQLDSSFGLDRISAATESAVPLIRCSVKS